MTNQEQSAADGAQAIQAGRDVTIHNGVSVEQMSEILLYLTKSLSFYHQEALEKVESRLSSFKDELIKVFALGDKVNPEAFRDPDFQYLLKDAQNAFARSGEESLRDTLIDIISRRSLQKSGTRVSITLRNL
jgi:hypothetical protein